MGAPVAMPPEETVGRPARIHVNRNQTRGVPMSTTRLSPLDASFLAVESSTAHMHVGWATTYQPPPAAPAPSFDQLFDHIESRLARGRRFRQRLARVPLGLNAPVWIDDDHFDARAHIVRAGSDRLGDVIDDC